MLRKSLFIFLLLLVGLPSAYGESTTGGNPRAKVIGQSFTFEKIMEGAHVTHDFVIKNTGDSTLDIESVRPGWGCTAVSYTRHIPPGGEGTIKIQVNTSGYGGRTLRKSIKVRSNDPKKKQFALNISGPVIRFATISPTRVRLSGNAGEEMVKTVRIIPEKEYPFKIIGLSAKNRNNIRSEYKTIAGPNGPEYLITITNIKEEAGRYFDYITVKTDSQIKPEMRIIVSGYIMKPKTQS